MVQNVFVLITAVTIFSFMLSLQTHEGRIDGSARSNIDHCDSVIGEDNELNCYLSELAKVLIRSSILEQMREPNHLGLLASLSLRNLSLSAIKTRALAVPNEAIGTLVGTGETQSDEDEDAEEISSNQMMASIHSAVFPMKILKNGSSVYSITFNKSLQLFKILTSRNLRVQSAVVLVHLDKQIELHKLVLEHIGKDGAIKHIGASKMTDANANHLWQRFDASELVLNWSRQQQPQKMDEEKVLFKINLVQSELENEQSDEADGGVEILKAFIEVTTIKTTSRKTKRKRETVDEAPLMKVVTERCKKLENSEKECCQYSAKVFFDDFGWSWVIAPKSIEYLFCYGTCEPYTTTPQTTHTQLTSTVGTLCCSADALLPIDVLIEDAEDMEFAPAQSAKYKRCEVFVQMTTFYLAELTMI